MKKSCSRREMLRRSLFLGAGGVLAGTALPAAAFSRVTTTSTQLEKVSVPLPGLPEELEGFRINFAADLHLSANTSFDFLASSLKILAAEAADLMVWGGDYVALNFSLISKVSTRLAHGDVPAIRRSAQVQALIAQLPELFRIRSQNVPSVAVRGNHELWVAPEQLAQALIDSDTSILINQSFQFTRGKHLIEVIGVDDFWNGIPRAPEFSSKAALKILVCHNPDYLTVLSRAGLTNWDLALCGHTHGGQIKLPLLGAFSYNITGPLTEGLFDLSQSLTAKNRAKNRIGAAVYVSRGLGVVEVPIRVNCPPEVTSLTLTRAVLQ